MHRGRYVRMCLNHAVLLATVIDPMFHSAAATRIRFLYLPSGIFFSRARRLFCISSWICGWDISFLIPDLSALIACSTILRKGEYGGSIRKCTRSAGGSVLRWAGAPSKIMCVIQSISTILQELRKSLNSCHQRV